MHKPDTTVAQYVGLAVAGIPILSALGFAFGLYSISDDQQKVLTDAVQWAGLVAGTLFIGDGIIRNGRSRQLQPAVQNLTVLDPEASAKFAERPPAQPGKVHSIDDTDVTAPEPGESPPPAGR